MAPDKIIIGCYEPVTLIGTADTLTATAKADPAADRSTIDEALLEDIDSVDSIGSVSVSSTLGSEMRDVYPIGIRLQDHQDDGRLVAVDVTDRSGRTGEVLLGRDFLSGQYLVDSDHKATPP